ncbi:uncharacterized protein BX663DRAFT_539207 [Cokeromyces recurvatus]|uniref:uncharacterized protein n=1 Tax=Cokeromyces recurvatus TaxID=90255 RepID=UPI0022211559|nr:uncharacterized protein BX663DRAFT_539207 [Cokeromyces recurvatus]KAI7907775.1 hypothetical protein BX663DRAFT_539207 [Cokeromyces recurvatus]
MTNSNILTYYAHLVTSNNSFEEYVPGSNLISKAVLTDTRIIVGVSSITASINDILAPATSHPFSKKIPSLFWAKRYLSISSTTLSTVQSTEQLVPLAAIGLFLCSQKLCITHLVSGSQDTKMKLLYKIAMNNIQQLLGEEEETTKGIKAICDNTYVPT